MDYELVLKALRQHVDVMQRAVDFYREHRKGKQFSDTFVHLQTAILALQHVEREKKKFTSKPKVH
jgi:hypothetical protein